MIREEKEICYRKSGKKKESNLMAKLATFLIGKIGNLSRRK